MPFRFNLDAILKWRETQRSLRKAAVAEAAAKLTAIEARRKALEAERAKEAAAVLKAPGIVLEAWPAFESRLRKYSEALEKQSREARENLAAELNRLTEADRAVRLLERLKQDRMAEWTCEQDRQEQIFADEAFLARRESGIIGKGGKS
jgi:flagellar export protein FliJ